MKTTKLLSVLCFLFLLYNCANQQAADQQKMSKEELVDFFQNMQNDGVNTDTLLLYGYFFNHSEEKNLKHLVIDLKNKGLDFVDLYENDGKYWLYMEKVEQHDATSLFNLQASFYEIANQYQVVYDGFDVGNPDKTKAISKEKNAGWSDFFKGNDFIRDGLPYLVIGNTEADKFLPQEDFVYFIIATIPYESNNKAMMPLDEEYDAIGAFESIIEQKLIAIPDLYFLYHNTHNGIRTAGWITKDTTNATRILRSLQQEETTRKFDFQIVKDVDWQLYKNVLKDLEVKVSEEQEQV